MVDEKEHTEWKPSSTTPTREPLGEPPVGPGAPGAGGPSGVAGGGKPTSIRDTWQKGSPDEIRDEMKRLVEKSVAAIAGVARGFAERAKQDDLAARTGEAIRRSGEAAERVIAETGEQVAHLRDTMRATMRKTGESTREVVEEAGEQTRKVREAAGHTMKETGESARKAGEAMERAGETVTEETGAEPGTTHRHEPPGP